MIDWNEISSNSHGGTETMARRLEKSLPKNFQKDFQIILSRVRDLDEDRIRILWCHDLPDDPESQHLADEGWKRFHHLVFVSHWQRECYVRKFEIPYSRTSVMHNAIESFKGTIEKPDPKEEVRLIYHTTPHRGLELLVPVYERLCEEFDNLQLDIYSSFQIYGWQKRDEPFEQLFNKIREHPKMTYHGYQPLAKVRAALKRSHIFAFPSIWKETSCLALMEAMGSRVLCVHPDLAALPETAANWTAQYDYHEDHNAHAGRFHQTMKACIQTITDNYEMIDLKLAGQKSYTELFYNWDVRKVQWKNLLNSLKNQPRAIEKPSGACFEYRVA